jgi:hypothetical protein
VSFATQVLQVQADGTFHDVWSPGTPNTLKVDGAMTLPFGASGASISAALACFGGSPTGSMSAFWSGSHYDGTYAFDSVAGTIVVIGLAWSSSNPAVATVDQRGTATAVSPGETTITATYGSLCWQTTPGVPSCVGTISGSATLHVTESSGGGGGGGGPIMTAGPDRTVECSSHAGASVPMQGAIFFEPQDPLTYTWTGPFGSATGLTPTVTVPLGAHELTFTISDGTRSASDTTTITVLDTAAPVVSSFTATPSEIWPPNHRMQPVSFGMSRSDVCDAELDCQIVSVTGTDGATEADWEVTGPGTVSLRATRTGQGDGRVYTVTVECRDDAGNTTRRSVAIAVPHDRGK